MLTKDGAILGVHPKKFGPTSVQFKGEINDTHPRKRHQKRHLEFCTAYLLSRGLGVRVSPGAPVFTCEFQHRLPFAKSTQTRTVCHPRSTRPGCRIRVRKTPALPRTRPARRPAA